MSHATLRIVRVPLHESLRERSYDILIEPGLFGRLPEALPVSRSSRFAIVTSENLVSSLGEGLCQRLHDVGFEAVLVAIPDGESSKSMEVVLSVVDRLLDSGIDRLSTLIALGGGVVGDLTGFVASVYMRGIDFLMIPTTLLAQVDAAVGGKVAVNHPRVKNLLGAFHQPRSVLIDPQLLATLPEREWRSGLAEVIKYGVIADLELFSLLEREQTAIAARDPELITELVERSCSIKAMIVARDERDEGVRAHLNFGHTVGHAIEACDYGRLAHGEAVALGMVAEASIGHRLGMLSADDVDRIRALLASYRLPVKWPEADADRAWSALVADKKNLGGRIRMVLPRAIGQVELVDPVPPDVVREAIRELDS